MKQHSLQLIQQRPEQIAESAQLETAIKRNLGGLGMNSDWSSMLLGDFIELKRGYDLPKKHRVLGKVPLISSAGLSDHHSEAKVTGPGVVTGRYGTIGEVYYVESDFWPLNTTLYIRDFKGNDPKFVYYFLKTIDRNVSTVKKFGTANRTSSGRKCNHSINPVFGRKCGS